jgi:isoquinoline 1-oxidoreductase beta subunit
MIRKDEHQRFELSRRQVLKASGAVGGGLLLSFYLPHGDTLAASTGEKAANTATFAPNAWLRIARDDRITIIVDKSEMGQGIMTALPMILAEELDADWSRVEAEFAPADTAYTNPLLAMQMTGGSTAVASSWDNLRRTGATARAMLLEAGASRLGVPTDECKTEKSRVLHKPSGKSVGYGELADSAAALPAPKNVRLKSKDGYTLIGQPRGRLDTAAKLEGRVVFGIDMKRAGLLTATVMHPPVFGAKVASFDSAKAGSMPGVREVLSIASGIAVVADSYWHASQAAKALEIKWTQSAIDALDDNAIRAQLRGRKDEAGSAVRKVGTVEDAFATAAKVISATYETPYQAHVTPEPMTCTAHVTDGKCEIWAPTQAQTIAQSVAAAVTGLDRDRIAIHTTFLGGGFGRRIEPDIVAEAVELSQKLRAPVKVIWSREEDLQHDHYHPATVIEMKAAFGTDGALRAWSHHLVSPSHMAGLMGYHRIARMPAGLPEWLRSGLSGVGSVFVDKGVFREQATEGASNLPYAIPHLRVSYTRQEQGIPTGNWRSVAHHYNCFAAECFIDELAAVAGKDPVEFRLGLIKDNSRLANVLKLAAQMAKWGEPLPEHAGRGVAIHDYKGTRVAHVAEVEVGGDGVVKPRKVWCVVDCGIVINPKIVTAQVESAIAFGLTAALKGSIQIKAGRVVQSNFHDYPILRMDEMPDVEVKIVESSETPTGIGETNVPPVAPATANAIFAATGKRIRKLPIKAEDLR